MKFKVRYLKPKESSFSVVEASSVYEAINDYHYDKEQGLSTPRRNDNGEAIERVIYAVCEAIDEEEKSTIMPARMFRAIGILRKGGVKYKEQGRSEEEIAEELGIEKDILHQEWYLEEQYP
jgi:hypothetical protein